MAFIIGEVIRLVLASKTLHLGGTVTADGRRTVGDILFGTCVLGMSMVGWTVSQSPPFFA